MTQLERLKIKLGIDASNEVLTLLLEDATNDFLLLTGRNRVPTEALGLIEDMAIYKHNQKDNKGISSQSYSGISETYATDYDNELKARIIRWRKLKML